MSMQFTVTLTGDISVEAEAADLGIDVENIGEVLAVFDSDVEFSDTSLVGTVSVESRVEVRNVEVTASDMENFDAEQAISEAVSPYGGISVTNADFETTEEPTGFDTVLEALGYDREQAIAVYAALENAGLVVTY